MNSLRGACVCGLVDVVVRFSYITLYDRQVSGLMAHRDTHSTQRQRAHVPTLRCYPRDDTTNGSNRRIKSYVVGHSRSVVQKNFLQKQAHSISSRSLSMQKIGIRSGLTYGPRFSELGGLVSSETGIRGLA